MFQLCISKSLDVNYMDRKNVFQIYLKIYIENKKKKPCVNVKLKKMFQFKKIYNQCKNALSIKKV